MQDKANHPAEKKGKANHSAGKKGKAIHSPGKKKFRNLSPKKNVKPKRVYKRYIQKKFRPEIFSDTIAAFNQNQKEWVNKTGFGELLNFKMGRYPHRLGYDIVESFDKSTSSLVLKNGSIEISEFVVNKVLGLPIGRKKIELDGGADNLTIWAEQFVPTTKSHVTATMVSKLLKREKTVNMEFKLNFLVFMTNFLIESNQNCFLKTDILSFNGNLDKCYEFKWCELLIARLKFTHAFWAADPEKRYFAGPLAFLIVSFAF